MAKNRYFLINYAAYMEDGSQFLGLSTLITAGKYVNKRKFIFDVKKEGEDNGQIIKSILITQINELTEQDYLDWYE